MTRLQLRPLTEEDEGSFREAVVAFEGEEPPYDFAFHYEPGEDFAQYVRKVDGWSRGEGLREGLVPHSFFVGVVDGVIVGRISLRHELNEFLRRIGGHIGYGVVPGHRGKGYASEMLRQALAMAGAKGISRVLVSCDVDNIASRRVIEKNGGVLEGTTDLGELEVQKHLFWISTERREQEGRR